MLRLSSLPGRGVYIGRAIRVTVADYHLNGATLTIEPGPMTAVSGPEFNGVEHEMRQHDAERFAYVAGVPQVVKLAAGEVVAIGRGILVTVLGSEVDGEVQLGVDAPRNVAVSRDDFTLAEHLRWQAKREAGPIERRQG